MRTLSVALAAVLSLPSWLPAQGYAPADAAKHMTAAPGFHVDLVAAEPLVRQPVCIEFDDRGRLWVVQYLQYPNPAGLKRVTVDRYSRTSYDRVPEPPPRGPRGADRITILGVPLHDGPVRQAKDFVSGLNLASGIAFGHGGVFVLQAPYLLFYPDRNGDDIPDGDPEVLLTGFGMEDAHSVANSLTWGPDGWLYGCQGSTVTARIRGIEFQQGVWRYHPPTRRFELFCEGGGNSWGLDFDRDGNLLYSTNVGGFCMLHAVQGGYYWKQFGKHGALHNPYAYGFFDHVPHKGFKGGHVTVGGIVYQGNAFPESFRDKYIAADLLGHGVYWHRLEPWGSSFRSAHGGDLLIANDTWFAPSDVTAGPDGAVYVADWFDRRTAHPDPDADWDRSNGRVYRIRYGAPAPVTERDLTKLSSAELVALLSHPNDWYVRKARRILGDRRDPAVVPTLRKLALESPDDHLALEALWALYVSGGFNDSLAEQFLRHRYAPVRSWTVRLLGDENHVSRTLARHLLRLASTEPDVRVRCQLACTARRLPAEDGLPVVWELARRDLDAADPYIPLLLWWAVEHQPVPAVDRVLDRFASPEAWRAPLVRDVILGRLMRRYAALGTDRGYESCRRLLASAPSVGDRRMLVAALGQGLQEQTGGNNRPLGTLFSDYATVEDPKASRPAPPPALPPGLMTVLRRDWSPETTDVTLIALLARLGSDEAFDRARVLALDRKTPEPRRVELVSVIATRARGTDDLFRLLDTKDSPAVQSAALAGLAAFDSGEVAQGLLDRYALLSPPLRSKAVDVLLSRERSALGLLRTIDRGRIPAKDVSPEQLRRVALLKNPELDRLVRSLWGSIQAGTPEEKLAEMRRLGNDLRAGTGDSARGKALFTQHCATCHRLFGEGNLVGPELTHANRKDREFLLASVVDPSAVIRKEYLAYVVQTKDGRVLTGLIADPSPGQLTLVDAKNERTVIPRDRIESVQESPVSLMPENLLKELKPQELRDLFSYLQK